MYSVATSRVPPWVLSMIQSGSRLSNAYPTVLHSLVQIWSLQAPKKQHGDYTKLEASKHKSTN